MKGHYIVIDPNGKKYYYRYNARAFNKFWELYWETIKNGGGSFHDFFEKYFIIEEC